MVKKRIRKTFSRREFKQTKISTKLFNKIKKIQTEMQMIENTRKGRKACTISFIFASDELAKRLNK